nr:ribonuclease H-like domain-containing protein [Tanacetum cinerariifolium]
MRPFGCSVTILNTLDPLGKFDGKANKGFLVGYSVDSKAFSVFNSRTRISQETLHINFLKNKPNVAGIGPKWLFDIDTLTKSTTGLQDPQNIDADVADDAFDVKENENDVHVSTSRSDKTEADLSNLETNIPASPIPTSRAYKYHLVNQIISDLNPAPQTRSMTRMVKEQGGQHQINDEDFHTCMFACFLSQEEPKKVHQALKDPSWIEAMQEELLQFKLQKLRALIDRKNVVVREDVTRRDLHLDDADGVECLPNEEIFTELARMVYEKPPPKLTFYKACSMASALICLATGRKFDFSKYILDNMVTELEQDKHTQALKILKLKKRVKKLEKKKRSKSSGFKRGKIEAIDVDENITLVDMESQEEVAAMDVELQGRIDQDDEVNAVRKGVNAAVPTIFDDEEVIMTMARTLIKIKAEKAKLLDEQIAQKLYEKEVEKAAAREKQEKDDLERAQVLQKQYDDKEENIDWNVVAE